MFLNDDTRVHPTGCGELVGTARRRGAVERRQPDPQLGRRAHRFRRRRGQLRGQGISDRLRPARRRPAPGGAAAALRVRRGDAGPPRDVSRHRRLGRRHVRLLRRRRAGLAVLAARPRGLVVAGARSCITAPRHVGTLAGAAADAPVRAQFAADPLHAPRARDARARAAGGAAAGGRSRAARDASEPRDGRRSGTAASRWRRPGDRSPR